jgi:hypothetical protein
MESVLDVRSRVSNRPTVAKGGLSADNVRRLIAANYSRVGITTLPGLTAVLLPISSLCDDLTPAQLIFVTSVHEFWGIMKHFGKAERPQYRISEATASADSEVIQSNVMTLLSFICQIDHLDVVKVKRSSRKEPACSGKTLVSLSLPKSVCHH